MVREIERASGNVQATVVAADTCRVTFVRPVLAAFLGALGWFVWTTSHESTGACYSGSHYVPSAAVALVVIVAVVVASLQPWQARRSVSLFTRAGISTAMLSAIGLLVAGFFAAAISCSGG